MDVSELSMRAVLPCRRAGFARILAAALLAATAGSCVEEVLRESMNLRLLPDGNVQVTVEIQVAPPEHGRSPEVENRLAMVRRELLEERDQWTRRFDRISPEDETFTRERRDGVLTAVARRVRLSSPEDLRRFFADTPLLVAHS